ncbi:hypothetical protein LCGC14_0142530 [marine sediment metagenome]|uniref:Uncharacterized protein n=1 Tax=marine sediment metagenome TaxID=412755 RepID=A0A0F9Y2V4_9ZZZZ
MKSKIKKKLMKIWDSVICVWLFGGGLCLALLGLIFSWKITLVILVAWMLSIVALVVYCIEP